MQQRTTQMTQANGLPNGSSRSSSCMPNGGLAGQPTSAMPNGLSGPLGPSNQSRPQPGMQGLPNGIPSNSAFSANMIGTKALTQAQMQAGLAAGRGLGNSPEHMRILYEANRLQQQQQMMLAARQHHQQQQQGSTGSTGQHSSPNMPNAGLAGANGNPNSPAFLAALAASNGVPSPSMTGTHANGVGSAGSPRLTNGHPLSSGMTPAISQLVTQIQRQNPEMTPEEIQRLATSQLNLYRQQAAHNVSQKSMNQAALNAAAGAVNASAHSVNASSYGRQQGMMTNEQVQAYNAQLRQQQAAQRANGGYGASLGAGLGMNMNGNMSGMGSMAGFTGSPVLNMSRPVSNHAVQGQPSRSATPRDQRGSSSGGMAQGSPRGGQGQM
jgi:chromatin modification-related protein VID21